MPDSLLPLLWHLLASSVPSILLRLYQRRMLQEGSLNIPRGSIVPVSVSSVLLWVCFSRETVEAVVVIFQCLCPCLSLSTWHSNPGVAACPPSPEAHTIMSAETGGKSCASVFKDREWLRYSTRYWLVHTQHKNNLENIDSKRMHKVFCF